MIATGLFGAFLWWRGKLVTTRWYLQIVQYGWWLGFVAVLCGWITTEVGRQPWIAHGILRTADAISPVAGRERADHADPVRHRLRHRVHDGHLLHQPPDRARPAGPRDRGAATARRAGRSPPQRRGARSAGRADHGMVSPGDLGRTDRRRRRALRHPRRLRSRHRHPVSLRQERQGARPDDLIDRAVLGRQRDLAGARRRRIVGRVSARLCGRSCRRSICR